MLSTAAQPVKPTTPPTKPRDRALRESHPRRCSAKISNGKRRCLRYAIAGSNVCPTHGGRAPQVKLSARARLDAMVEPAMALLEKSLRAITQTPGMEMTPLAVKLAGEVMDRAGYGRVTKVELEQIEAHLTDAHVKAMVTIMRRACELAKIDLKDEAVRASLHRAMKEWAERNRKAGGVSRG